MSAGRLMLKNNHNQDLRLYGISFFSTPIISSAMLISSIALIGISFIRGYYSKHIIITWSTWLPINSIIYFRLLLIIFLTFTYSMRIIIFIRAIPTKKYSIIEQNRSINNKTSLTIMSLARIITGRIIQWFSPLIDNLSLINENIKYIILDFMPITITIYIYLRIKFYYKNQTTTKIFRSLILITPISTQFILPQYLNLSLLLYKYLDQIWLEKLSSIGLPKILLNLSSIIDLNFTKYPQNNLSARAIITIITLGLIIIINFN